MGSIRFRGVIFIVYTRDHLPPHVHAVYGDLTVILEFSEKCGLVVASRPDALTPRKPKRNEVRRVIRCAKMNEELLLNLWEEIHGPIPD